MRNTLVLCLLFFATTYTQAQDYDILFTSTYSGKTTEANQRSYESTIRAILTDTTSLETTSLNTVLDSFRVEPKYSIGLNVGQRFQVLGKGFLRTDLGVEFQFYRTISSSNFISQEVISTTIVPSDNSNGPFNPPVFCQEFLNSFSDFPELDPDPKISLLNLNVGLEFIYPIVGNDLYIGIGSRLNTPLYSLKRNDQVNLIRHPIEGEDTFECEFVLEENRDSSGQGFRNLVMSANAFVEYTLFDKFLFRLGYEQSLSDVYIHSPNQFTGFLGSVDESYKPKRVFLSAGYFFNRKANFDDEPDAEM